MARSSLLPLRLLAFLAWRGLGQSKLITALLCAAVAAGVAFQIPNDANLQGYEAEIITQGVVVGSGDVRVRPRQGARFADADALAATLAARPGVVAAVPALTLPGAIGTGGNFHGALVVAVDATAPRVPFVIAEGAAIPPGDGASIVVGAALARRANLRVGDEVQLRIVFGGLEAIKLDDLGRYTMKIRGLAAGSFLGPEAIIVDRRFLTLELAEPHAASMILVHLGDHGAARLVASRLERDLPAITAAAWADDSPFLGNALDASAAIGLVSRAMVAIAVLIPVWALLYVHVLHRQRQIGVMCAIGLSRGEVFAVYLTQAALVGLAGAAVGCAAGLGLVAWFARHPIFRSTGFVIHPIVDLGTVLVPAALVLATTIVAGVFPAWRAARIAPARILRGTT